MWHLLAAALRSGVRPEAGNEPCFSFLHDGAPSAGFLCDWGLDEEAPCARGGAAAYRIARPAQAALAPAG